MGSTSSVRIHVLLARGAHHGVIFRRGPSKQVLLLKWNTATDEIELGQWFKGRIYERRCDLSPAGDKLIYFAAKHRRPYFTWTAVSRPPYLTALALWPKGDAWGGGGLFAAENRILLNHRAEEMALGDDFRLPRRVKIEPFGERPGWGEDSPIWNARLIRDGWQLESQGQVKENRLGSAIWFEFTQPQVWTRKRPGRRSFETLRMRVLGINERGGPWYVLEHDVVDAGGNVIASLGRSDWADWSPEGDLLFAARGQLNRLKLKANRESADMGAATVVADLRSHRFQPKAAPPDAREW